MKKITARIKKALKLLFYLAEEFHSFIAMLLIFVFNTKIIDKYSGEYCIGFIVSAVIIIILILNEMITILLEEKNKIPIAKRRYTIKDKNGDIKVKEADIQLAIIYLSQIEDYIERNALNDE